MKKILLFLVVCLTSCIAFSDGGSVGSVIDQSIAMFPPTDEGGRLIKAEENIRLIISFFDFLRLRLPLDTTFPFEERKSESIPGSLRVFYSLEDKGPMVEDSSSDETSFTDSSFDETSLTEEASSKGYGVDEAFGQIGFWSAALEDVYNGFCKAYPVECFEGEAAESLFVGEETTAYERTFLKVALVNLIDVESNAENRQRAMARIVSGHVQHLLHQGLECLSEFIFDEEGMPRGDVDEEDLIEFFTKCFLHGYKGGRSENALDQYIETFDGKGELLFTLEDSLEREDIQARLEVFGGWEQLAYLFSNEVIQSGSDEAMEAYTILASSEFARWILRQMYFHQKWALDATSKGILLKFWSRAFNEYRHKAPKNRVEKVLPLKFARDMAAKADGAIDRVFGDPISPITIEDWCLEFKKIKNPEKMRRGFKGLLSRAGFGFTGRGENSNFASAIRFLREDTPGMEDLLNILLSGKRSEVKTLIDGLDADVGLKGFLGRIFSLSYGLTKASGSGDFTQVEAIVRQGALVNRQFPIVRIIDEREEAEEGFTPLTLASRKGHTEVVRVLLENGAIPDLRNAAGRTPLWIASAHNHMGIVSLLSEPNAIRGDNPLWVAAKNGHIGVVTELLARGANPNLVNQQGLTPLWIAAKYNHLDVVNSLLEAHADSTLETSRGSVPLRVASRHGHTEVVRRLIEEGSLLGLHHIYTALNMARSRGYQDIVELLRVFLTQDR